MRNRVILQTRRRYRYIGAVKQIHRRGRTHRQATQLHLRIRHGGDAEIDERDDVGEMVEDVFVVVLVGGCVIDWMALLIYVVYRRDGSGQAGQVEGDAGVDLGLLPAAVEGNAEEELGLKGGEDGEVEGIEVSVEGEGLEGGVLEAGDGGPIGMFGVEDHRGVVRDSDVEAVREVELLDKLKAHSYAGAKDGSDCREAWDAEARNRNIGKINCVVGEVRRGCYISFKLYVCREIIDCKLYGVAGVI